MALPDVKKVTSSNTCTRSFVSLIMFHEQNVKPSEDNRPSTATTLVHDTPHSPESDVLIVDWDGPDDPGNPKK